MAKLWLRGLHDPFRLHQDLGSLAGNQSRVLHCRSHPRAEPDVPRRESLQRDRRQEKPWRLYFEWFDTQGVPMGRYTQAALWAGWMNMFRVDGWTLMDFSILSAREIEPAAIPSENAPANRAKP